MNTILRSAFLLLAFCLFPSLVLAQDAESCETEYNQAEEAYFTADFDTAIRLLETCLDEVDLSNDDRTRFYRLLGFAYLAQGNQEQARLAVENLFDLDESYEARPEEDRPDFVQLVEEVRASRSVAEEEEEGRRWWRWIAGGAATAVVGAAAVLLTGGNGNGGGPEPLPTPPIPNN